MAWRHCNNDMISPALSLSFVADCRTDDQCSSDAACSRTVKEYWIQLQHLEVSAHVIIVTGTGQNRTAQAEEAPKDQIHDDRRHTAVDGDAKDRCRVSGGYKVLSELCLIKSPPLANLGRPREPRPGSNGDETLLISLVRKMRQGGCDHQR